MISRIPPFSARETINYYASGKIPERFRDSDEARHKEILEPYIHDDKPQAKDVYDYLKAGGFVDEE